ncbi:hypothetical protein QFZ58_000268 [Streptomyces sp. B1I3]|nr:hypothetical protein [Streptomyces sp. B1I3]
MFMEPFGDMRGAPALVMVADVTSIVLLVKALPPYALRNARLGRQLSNMGEFYAGSNRSPCSPEPL